MNYLLFFLGGAAGSLHCVGMCGGFALAIGGGGDRRNAVLRQVLYNAGRVNTLVFIGAVSGALGAAVVAAGPVRWIEQALAVTAGVFMIVVGLEVLGVLAQITTRGAALAQATVGRMLGGVMRSRSLAAPVALGVFNAFLPCQLIYAFAAQAASSASVVEGMLTMLCFGLGTVPAMMAVGVARDLLRPRWRARLSLMSGVLVIAFGIVTLLRGLDLLPHGGGHDHHPHSTGHESHTRDGI